MNSSLSTMYDDFFNSSLLSEQEVKEVKQVTEIDIDSLLLSEESKNLLKKIIKYINDYKESKVSNYITFNIILNCNNKETIDKVVTALSNVAPDYLKNSSTSDFSLFSLNANTVLSDIYKSGIVKISDFKAFQMKELSDKALFIHELKNNLSDKNITILSDSKENVDDFLYNDNELKDKYFVFELNGVNPSIQDVYNEVLEKVNISDELKVKLLDYISDTFGKSNYDYVSYRDKLVNYIAFNNDIPVVTKTKTNEEIFKELNDLVGLKDVKDALFDLVNLITLKSKTKDSLNIKDINLHMVFLGNPGTGKTTVARLLSGILFNLGYIKEDKLIEVSSKDLVAEYVGQTAPKTNAVLEKAKGGILFIDEAYALASDGNSSYNDEAIATLIKGMEDYRDELVVIFAGYTKEMQKFLDSNSGIVSRVGYTLNFKDYTIDELLEIFKGMVKKGGFEITDDALEQAKEFISQSIGTKNFGNARFVRNMYEKTIVKHATNTKDKKKKEVLVTISKDDVSIDNLIKEEALG